MALPVVRRAVSCRSARLWLSDRVQGLEWPEQVSSPLLVSVSALTSDFFFLIVMLTFGRSYILTFQQLSGFCFALKVRWLCTKNFESFCEDT